MCCTSPESITTNNAEISLQIGCTSLLYFPQSKTPPNPSSLYKSVVFPTVKNQNLTQDPFPILLYFPQ